MLYNLKVKTTLKLIVKQKIIRLSRLEKKIVLTLIIFATIFAIIASNILKSF
jgi:cell division protein FtsL